MADNTDEEHLNTPTENQLENPSEEITPTAETENFNPNKETENMKVHHHAHNPWPRPIATIVPTHVHRYRLKIFGDPLNSVQSHSS